ncbi:MAG: hypothetical protein V1789_10700 [PVC group bacterium]
MKIQDLNLSVHEYCHEESTVTVQGTVPHPLDLPALARAGKKLTEQVMLMDRLEVLYLTLGGVTVHIHRNGEIVVNRVGSIEEAERILSLLLGDDNRSEPAPRGKNPIEK